MGTGSATLASLVPPLAGVTKKTPVEPDLLPSSGTEAWLEDLGTELQASDFMNKFWRQEKSWCLIFRKEDQHLVH